VYSFVFTWATPFQKALVQAVRVGVLIVLILIPGTHSFTHSQMSIWETCQEAPVQKSAQRHCSEILTQASCETKGRTALVYGSGVSSLRIGWSHLGSWQRSYISSQEAERGRDRDLTIPFENAPAMTEGPPTDPLGVHSTSQCQLLGHQASTDRPLGRPSPKT
jgi:hypothetical protein